MMKSSEVKETTTKKKILSKADLISIDYVTILINQILISDDTMSIFNAKSRLRFYDTKLKEMGLRATIKVGTEKIE